MKQPKLVLVCNLILKLIKMEDVNNSCLFFLDQVDHYYFFTTISEFMHFYTYNSLVATVVSTPEKKKERGFFFYGDRFYVGSFDTF